MVLVVLLFCVFMLFKIPKGSVARLLFFFFILSLSGYVFLFKSGGIQTIDILHAIWIIITICAIVLPWKNFRQIKEITCNSKERTDRFATILIVICILLDISCGILAYYVLTRISDINMFKYVDGPSDFYYSLGIDMHGFILTTLLYPLGYLLVPFVFYYFSQRRYARAFWSFVGSLLPVVYGMTYYSRSHMTHFIMIYIAAFFMLRKVLPKIQSKRVRNVILAVGIGVSVGFFYISSERFEEHDYNTQNRNITYNTSSSTAISMIDYLSQWWPNSQEMFRRFDGTTMNNSIIFQAVSNFANTISFGIIPNDSKGRLERRTMLFKEYTGSFIGVGAYTLYDQGPFLGLLLYALYGWFVRKYKPHQHTISITSLLVVFALIQIPLFAIFYSTFDVVLLMLLLLIPIMLFLKTFSPWH